MEDGTREETWEGRGGGAIDTDVVGGDFQGRSPGATTVDKG